MVKLGWCRVEVEMERGSGRNKTWWECGVGMKLGQPPTGFWPALRRCVGLRGYHQHHHLLPHPTPPRTGK